MMTWSEREDLFLIESTSRLIDVDRSTQSIERLRGRLRRCSVSSLLSLLLRETRGGSWVEEGADVSHLN